MQDTYALAVIILEIFGILFLLVLVYKVRRDLKLAYKQFYRALIHEKKEASEKRESDDHLKS